MGCHFLLQGIFPTQGSNEHLLCLLHYKWILYPLSHQGSLTVITEIFKFVFPLYFVLCIFPLLMFFHSCRYFLPFSPFASFFFFFFSFSTECFKVLFIWLCQVSVEACRVFHCSTQGMWDLVTCSGIKPRPPALRATGPLGKAPSPLKFCWFTFGCAESSLLCADFLPSQWARASPCSGFSCCRAQALEHAGFSGCGAQI